MQDNNITISYKIQDVKVIKATSLVRGFLYPILDIEPKYFKEIKLEQYGIMKKKSGIFR